ncbi:MAG: hypothetical protein QOD49_2692, partial [Actinomycetota bacterium]|nr:hypothetical protein [Actinomycetota bacterium]
AFLKGQWGSLPATSVNPQAEGKDLYKLSIGCGAAHQAGSPTSGPRRAPISTQWGPLGLEALDRDLREPGWEEGSHERRSGLRKIGRASGE